jgi:hypothetical protein
MLARVGHRGGARQQIRERRLRRDVARSRRQQGSEQQRDQMAGAMTHRSIRPRRHRAAIAAARPLGERPR